MCEAAPAVCSNTLKHNAELNILSATAVSESCIQLGTFIHPCSWTCQPRLTSPFTEDLHNLVEDSSANRDMEMKRCANTSILITRHERSLDRTQQTVRTGFYKDKVRFR